MKKNVKLREDAHRELKSSAARQGKTIEDALLAAVGAYVGKAFEDEPKKKKR